LTKEDWKTVEDNLKLFYTLVKLKCDGYNITLRLERLTQFKNGIAIYVNGKFEGKWLIEDCEERRRFLRSVNMFLYTQKQRANMKKISKGLRKKCGLPDPDVRSTYWTYYWNSFQSLKRHLIKNNTTIELLTGGGGRRC
jgi:hypothetical protein